VPVILNTSFNDNGEPIVETPKDAVKALKTTNLDALIIGDYLVVPAR
jgi:carbamoyltransferase